jgi:hypothetical protein
MKHFFQSALLLAIVTALVTLGGCATIFNGSMQNVKLRTDPGGAYVTRNGQELGVVTPTKIKVPRTVPASRYNRANEQVYTFKREGYKEITIKDRRHVNGLALTADIVVGLATGFIPLIVDFATGSIYRYNRKIDVKLIPETPPATPSVPIVAEKPVTPPVNTVPARTEPVPANPWANEPRIDTNIPQTGKTNPNAIAVVIGIHHYMGQDIPDVQFARRDAETMKAYLVNTFGFREGNILMLPDAKLSDLTRTFGNNDNHRAQLFNMVKPGESDVFIYYNGHGAPSVNTQDAFLVPSDCKDVSLIEFEGYALNTLYKNLGEIPYRSLTMVLDACFSGGSESGALIRNASPVFIKSRPRLVTDERVQIFASSQGDQISSWFTPVGHSLFTYYFLRGIQGAAKTNPSQQHLTIGELKYYLLENVPYMARRLHNRSQVPEISGSEISIMVNY